MSHIKTDTILNRFNEAIHDLLLAKIESRNGNNSQYQKHKKDAGEAISQTIEYALKYFLEKKMSEIEKSFFRFKDQNISTLLDKFRSKDGSEGDYLYDTISDTIKPNVDFQYLRNNKRELTNASKHEGAESDFQIQLDYIEEVRKFIQQYIDSDSTKLKTIEQLEQVDISTWYSLYTACDRFRNEERNFILVIGPNSNTDNAYLKTLAYIKWNLIIDYDYNSKINGFYNIAYAELGSPPHQIKASDIIDINTFSRNSLVHYHYFINNFKGSGDQELNEYSDWNKKYSRKTETFIKSFAEVMFSQKNIVLILFNSRQHINFLCEKITREFGDNTVFVFANDKNGELDQTCIDNKGVKVNISIPEITEGILNHSSNFEIENLNENEILIPFNDKTNIGTTGILSASEYSQIDEHFELLHKGIGTTPQEQEDDRRTFLCGENKISWFGLKNRFDVERQNFNKQYLRPIEAILESGRGKVFLVHEAGFGGTTLARRIAWEIHNEYPTLILRKYKEIKIKEWITLLHQKTRKPIFVVMEAPQSITLDEVDTLYKLIPDSRPVVFLIVKRGKPKTNDLSVPDWGNDAQMLVNQYKPYLKEYGNNITEQKKNKELDEIIDSIDSWKKTPFYIGLLTFEEKFYAIKDFIKKFVDEVRDKDEQRKVLIYLSLCDEYLGQGLPSSFFKTLFKAPKSDIIHLENYFSQDSTLVESLLSSSQEGHHKFWRIRHNFFAKELKIQLLDGSSSGNTELWRNMLPSICVNFIEDSVTDSATSVYIQELLQKMFIGNRRERTEESFASIINDIVGNEGKERVLLALKNNYPDDAHFCSHLARFYAYYYKNSEKALKYADEAIRLAGVEGPPDSLLYHIKGMCLRTIAEDKMKIHRENKSKKIEVSRKDYEYIINYLIPSAAAEFDLSRQIARKQNRLDGHGYIAHIQLLTRAIDYAITMSGKSKSDFFKHDPEPFSEWLELCESLLEDVKRIDLDEKNSKIVDCENDIQGIYENYEVILQNLRNQLDKGKTPSRTRRQIVRTYFKRKTDFSNDSKIVNNILNYMELNILNEYNNEKNYYLWFQAARFSNLQIDDALSKLSQWKTNSSAIDSVYYFYILKVFRALQGYSEATIEAYNLIKECRQIGRSNTTIFEWYGKGSNLKKLVNRNQIEYDNKEDKLELVNGYFTEFLHDGRGIITIVDKLEVFFSPTLAKLTSSDLNKEVEFYLGFSYDGLRADSYSVRIKGTFPRNFEVAEKELSDFNKLAILKKQYAETKKTVPTGLPHAKKMLGKVKAIKFQIGFITSDVSGKDYFFHRSNMLNDSFKDLKEGSNVSFEPSENEKGLLALNIEIVKK